MQIWHLRLIVELEELSSVIYIFILTEICVLSVSEFTLGLRYKISKIKV